VVRFAQLRGRQNSQYSQSSQISQISQSARRCDRMDSRGCRLVRLNGARPGDRPADLNLHRSCHRGRGVLPARNGRVCTLGVR